MFGSFGWMELLLVLFIVLIIFGAGKLPQIGEGVGKAIKGFKKSIHETETAEASDHAPEQFQMPSQNEQIVQEVSPDQQESPSSSPPKPESIHKS